MSHVYDGPNPAEDADLNKYELSAEFVANADITISHIRVFGTANAVALADRKARIWNPSNGSVIGIASLPSTMSLGWTNYALDVPLERTAGQRFLVSYSSNGKYSFRSGVHSANVVSSDGAATMLSTTNATAGNGRITPTLGTYPTTATPGTFWGVDVEYTLGVGENTAPTITAMTLSSPSPLVVNASITATDEETMVGATYRFDWGDGTPVTTGSSSTASHTYATPGVKAVLGTVLDADGLSDSAAAGISLQPAPAALTARSIITTQVIEPWLYNLLSTDATLISLVGESVSGTLSGELLTVPYVTFLLQDHGDVQGVGGQEIMGDCLYMVKAVDRAGGWDTVNPIARRIHALLHRPHTNITVPGGSLTTIRERIIQYPEVEEGVQYRHLGGIYRIQASHDT